MIKLSSKNNYKTKLTNSYLGGGVKYTVSILYSEIKLSNIKSNKVIVD